MKVNTKKESKICTEDGGIILSIGMIVKNEEKVLRRCLDSLKPLMEQISCELIIADTGSTDSTVEIAKEYTDNVFHFEWINDFAAARNSTLEKAKGQWYMFIDADEYLDEDIGEMVHFFKIPELRSKYKTLEIMLRSYGDDAKTDYVDGCLVRFQRIDDPNDPIYFVGSVHEGMWIRYPLGYFSTIIHHTGYVYSSQKQMQNKKERNLALMREEYKNNPNDLRMLSHLLDGCNAYPLEMEKYIDEALKIIKTNRGHFYANVVYMQAITYYKKLKPEYALQLCDEYYYNFEKADNCVATVAISALKLNLLSSLGRYEEACNELKNYIRLYNDYKNDKLVLTDMSAHPIYGLTEHEYYKFLYTGALCFQKLRKYDEAFELIKDLSFEKLDGEQFRELLGTIREICKDKKDYAYMAKSYGEIMKTDSNDKKSLALYMLENVYYSLLSGVDRQVYALDMINSGVTGKYIDLMRLVVEQNDSDGFKTKLVEFVNNVDDWNDGYSEAIYLSIKYGIDISENIDKMKASLFRVKLEEIANANDDFAE